MPEITKDGATWFWYCEQVTDEPELASKFGGELWRPVLQCDGWVMCDDGLAFPSQQACQAWIDEAVKAAPVTPWAATSSANGEQR
jgi:hypothetical protein